MRTVDPREARKRLDRIAELYAGIVEHAHVLSAMRCPYKDRNGCCTASFGCRNKRKRAGEAPLCAGDDRLNYRSAWEIE